jgi:hypothetical protein
MVRDPPGREEVEVDVLMAVETDLFFMATGSEDNKGHNNQIVGWGARALRGDRVKGTEWRGMRR